MPESACRAGRPDSGAMKVTAAYRALGCLALLATSSLSWCQTQSFLAIRDNAPMPGTGDRYRSHRESDLSWVVFRLDKDEGCCEAHGLAGSQIVAGPRSPVLVRNELRESTVGLALGLVGIGEGRGLPKSVNAEVNTLALSGMDDFGGLNKLGPIPIDFIFGQIKPRDSILVADYQKLSKPLHVRGLILFGSRIVKVRDPKVREYPITFVFYDPSKAGYRYFLGKALLYGRNPGRKVEEHLLSGEAGMSEPFHSNVGNGEAVSNEKYLPSGTGCWRSSQVTGVEHGSSINDRDNGVGRDDHDGGRRPSGRRRTEQYQAYCGNSFTY